MIRQGYTIMLTWDSYQLEDRSDPQQAESAKFLVQFHSRNLPDQSIRAPAPGGRSLVQAFVWVVSKQTEDDATQWAAAGEEHLGCWMTDAVYPFGG